jgi:hypothetical protein
MYIHSTCMYTVYFPAKIPNLGILLCTLEWIMLIHFISTWNILRPYGIFCGNWVYIICGNLPPPRFGIFYQEKSGNPDIVSQLPLSRLNHKKIWRQSGLSDFSWYKIPKREKYTKLTRTIPNVHKNITKDLKMDQVSSSIARPSKIDPNLDFWFENKPSGNPGIVSNYFVTRRTLSFRNELMCPQLEMSI